MMTDKEIEMFDYVVECGICTAGEIDLVKAIVGGTWESVINAIIYVRTIYCTYEEWLQEECE